MSVNYTHGGDVYTYAGVLDFSVNVNPLAAPESIRLAAVKALDNIDRYPDYACRRLRADISGYYGIEQENIICGNGAAELIYVLAAAIRPKKALLTAPGFHEYANALKSVGCDIRYHFLREENGFSLGPDYIDELNRNDDIDIIFLCTPHNPSGRLISGDLLSAVVGMCQRKGIRMVVDESFMDFCSGADGLSVLDKVNYNDRLCVLKSFTKIYRMPGLRLGFLATSDEELTDKMYKARQPWSVSESAMEAGIAALGEKEYVIKTREYIKKEREFLMKSLMQTGGFKVYASDANFILFRADESLWRRLLEQKILIRDCGGYEGLKPGFYRIAIKGHEENLRLLGELDKICAVL